ARFRIARYLVTFLTIRPEDRRVRRRDRLEVGRIDRFLVADAFLDDAHLDQPVDRVFPGERLRDVVQRERRKLVAVADALRHAGVLDPQVAVRLRIVVDVFGGAHVRPQERLGLLWMLLKHVAADGQHALAEVRPHQRAVVFDQDRAFLDGRLRQRIGQHDDRKLALKQKLVTNGDVRLRPPAYIVGAQPGVLDNALADVVNDRVFADADLLPDQVFDRGDVAARRGKDRKSVG